jgi:hypothetical protein
MNSMKKQLIFLFSLTMVTVLQIQAQTDLNIYNIIDSVSAKRIKQDVKTLTEFGTRNTFSDTISNTRGIGAARRWIKSEFETISKKLQQLFRRVLSKRFGNYCYE